MANTAQSPYRERVGQVRHQLEQEGENFQTWAKKNGYTTTQVYVVTRRYEPARFGIAREIAEKLGLINQELTH